MTHASLFTGIGGFDLAAEWCGWANSFQCEIDPFCQKVLAKNFPDADRHTDIKGFDARRYRGTVDVLSGGFPCQPFSKAGKRRGNSDDRALWPQMLRIIDEVRPRWVVGENVAGLLTLGIDSILFDLEASGYACRTVVLPACGVGAPHQRDRLWIIAHAHGNTDNADPGASPEAHRISQEHWPQQLRTGQPERADGFTPHANPNSERLQEYAALPFADDAKRAADSIISGYRERRGFRLTESPLCGPNDGLPAGLVRVSTRAKQLKAYGNSIVPQVALEIFRAINQVEAL